MHTKNLLRTFIVALFVIAVAAAYYFEAGSYLTLSTLRTSLDVLLQFVSANPVVASALFIGIYLMVVALSIPGAAVLTLASGALFGPILGTLLTNIGATTGAVLVFLFARFVLGEHIQEKYPHRLKRFNKNVRANAVQYLLTLRLVPIFPFFLINLLAGLAPIRLRTFAWTTAVGIIPGSFAYAFAGSQLAQVSSLSDVISPGMFAAFILLAAVTFLPKLYQRHRTHLQPTTTDAPSTSQQKREE